MRQNWTIFLSMDTKMSLFCGEAGSSESLRWLHFEDGFPLLLEGVGALLSGFPITTRSKHSSIYCCKLSRSSLRSSGVVKLVRM